jgi:hypothetical protein
MQKGEWFAASSLTRGNDRIARGSVYLPRDWDHADNDELCVTLPWYMIVELVHESAGGGDVFDLDKASELAPEYQVTAFHDTDFSDQEDFFTAGNLDISDWVPNTDDTATDGTVETTPPCSCDHDNDGDCDGTDAFSFKSGFGTSTCPECNM